jgi:glycosyltransferase involved in cell wall biosynthesis
MDMGVFQPLVILEVIRASIPLDNIVVVTPTVIIASLSLILVGLQVSGVLLRSRLKKTGSKVLGFFHPYCDSGGGGERVLWVSIAALMNNERLREKFNIVIYASCGQCEKERILVDVCRRFSIDIVEHADRIHLIPIWSVFLMEARWYPVFTMLMQSIGSVVVGMECILKIAPDIFCDTTGAAFTYPWAKLYGGCRVAAYVHYPTISTDMLQLVREQRPTYNNDKTIAGIKSISSIKLVYYRIFAAMYSFVGYFADDVMVNSSWTEGHIASLWGREKDPRKVRTGVSTPVVTPMKGSHNTSGKDNSSSNLEMKESVSGEGNDGNNSSIAGGTSTANTGGLTRRGERRPLVKLYPPCNTSVLQWIPMGDSYARRRVILSVGQFRPEKDHMLQLR